MTVEIRTALPGDREAVLDLLQELNRFEDAITGDRLTDRAAAAATYDALLDRIARREGRLLVAVAEGRVVGMMGWVVETDEPYVREEVRRAGVVTDLVVQEGSRGQGIGRLLLGEAERLTREAGLRRLTIGALVGNDGARRAYEAFGFCHYVQILTKSLA